MLLMSMKEWKRNLTPEFQAHIIKRSDDTTDPLAKEAARVRLPVHIDSAIRALPNRSAWLRRVITEAAQRELMNKESKTK
jgi:hypothetical protein